MSTTLKFPATVKLVPQDLHTEERKGEKVTRWKRSSTILALKPSKLNGEPDHFAEAVVHGQRRLMIDSPKSVDFALVNPAGRNTLRVRIERAFRDKEGKVVGGKWEPVQADGFVPPGASLALSVGNGQRAIVEEMPS